MPEVVAGFGVGDDNYLGVDVEIERVLAINLRGSYAVNDKVSLFIQPSYAELKVKASTAGISVSGSDGWDFGFGGGVNYSFTEASSMELNLQRFDGTDVVGLGYRHAF
jgi:long-subunit fatty acid transport protein